MAEYVALSIVSPHGGNIASGRKTIEVRSWSPSFLPLKDLLIVENEHFLTQEGQIDPHGNAVALVDVVSVEPWVVAQVDAACSCGWEPGYFAWRLENIRPLVPAQPAIAARKLYKVELPQVANNPHSQVKR
ncbi:ASCH domain-containing protein [Hydrogenophaga sp.]|uniref:ASCH domain-containing protein n=1 Tax=Hydrogenophaga sp. TaxID=1904254 RepID=UPI003BB096E5